MMHLFCVIGTRPEAIKMAPVIWELKARGIPHEVCCTGQHDIEDLLQTLKVDVDSRLFGCQCNSTLAESFSTMVADLGFMLDGSKYDGVIVQGDTTSATAGALAAYYAGIKVWHVEAGLRSGDLANPFPEEGNRRLIDQLSYFQFWPTVYDTSVGLGCITGNTVIDTLQWALQQKECIYYGNKSKVLVTAHRREAWGEGIESICDAVGKLAISHPDIHVIWPMHFNPAVRKPIEQAVGFLENVELLEPVDYLDFVQMMRACQFVATDSGGLQEEAAYLGKRVVIMRENTERYAGRMHGIATVAGLDSGAILLAMEKALAAGPVTIQEAKECYGDGKARKVIADAIERHYSNSAD